MKFINSHLIRTLIVIGFCVGTHQQVAAQAPAKHDDHRFRRTVQFKGKAGPVELKVVSNGQVYWIDYRGFINRIDPATPHLKTIGWIDTHNGHEHGLIGIALAPPFTHNRWVYLLYFLPAKQRRTARFSRFTIRGGSLENASEKPYLEYPNEIDGCHTAGSPVFDSKGNLYATAGDNTRARPIQYAPTDERPDRLTNDALRSAGNTADFRSVLSLDFGRFRLKNIK